MMDGREKPEGERTDGSMEAPTAFEITSNITSLRTSSAYRNQSFIDPKVISMQRNVVEATVVYRITISASC